MIALRLALALLLILGSPLLFASVKPPKLIVQIVVDQLRGDLISRHQQKMTEEGFKYLLAHGLDYKNAHFSQANTVTCVGHAVIATGTNPDLHGIIANNWFDRKTGLALYCVDDSQSPVLATPRTRKNLPGRSPKNLIASTLSDELALAKTGRAFAVSWKDRSAITLAGHAGKAFWFDTLNGGFVSSSFYYSAYPQWVNDWNTHYEAKEVTWSLNQLAAKKFINVFPEFGQQFYHKTGSANSNKFYELLSGTPVADELTADFAIKLLEQEKLGKNSDKTDVLNLSFSATDVIGHQFGPNSLEAEDNLIRLDKTLAKLLAAINKQVGLENTIIVLTADHGVSDSPAYLARQKIAAPHLLDQSLLQKIIEESLANRFQLPANSLQAIMPPYIYLNHQMLNEQQLAAASTFLADQLSQKPGIFRVFKLPLTNVASDWLSTKVNKMAFSGRSGDLYIVPLPHASLGTKKKNGASHGTPWDYDSYVPLIFVNPNFKAKSIFKPVSITDIAPTLAAILGIKAPSASLGQPLIEVLNEFES